MTKIGVFNLKMRQNIDCQVKYFHNFAFLCQKFDLNIKIWVF